MSRINDKTAVAIPLSGVPEGHSVRLSGLDCGKGMLGRLASMGLRVGVEFHVVKSAGRGPVVVALGNSRFALGRGVARRMLVTPRGKS